MDNKKTRGIALGTLGAVALVGAFAVSTPDPIRVKAEGECDVIASTSIADWFHNKKTEDQGTWSASTTAVTVDAYDGDYAMEGANYLTPAGSAYGAYSYEATINITELNAVQNPEVGIIPWYLDEDNYLYVEMKFTNNPDYLLSAEEKAEGYGIEQIICAGRYNGEAKYVTSTSQQENTVFDALTVASLKGAKAAPKAAAGHKLKVVLENSSATAINYQVAIYYNDVEVGSTYAYYYPAQAKNEAVGFMAQDVKASFTSAKVDDYFATNKTATLARDWKNSHDFTYRVQNGKDPWTFNDDGGVSCVTDPIKEGTTTVSQYRVSGSNLAGYDTNRGFTANPVKETEDGLPQNYSVEASFQLDELPEYKGTKTVLGYGLLAWYKDDENFVDVTIRRTVSGLAAAPTVKNELVLFGWLDCSSLLIGENVADLGESFDPLASHTIKVEKKSNAFYAYLDGGAEPLITKKVPGADVNYSYGYEGYNCKYSAGKIESASIYDPYDEITILDDQGKTWRVSGKSQSAWGFSSGTIHADATEAVKRSYLLGASDISDKNMTVEAEASLNVGEGYAEFLLAPYVVDDDNYARLGLIQKEGKVYAYISAASYTEEDMDNDKDPRTLVRELPLNDVTLGGSITLKAEKIDTTLALYVNGKLVYGTTLEGIDQKSSDYGVYLANMDASITSLETEGYKRYSMAQVGDWTTSGMKYNAWTIDENGYLAGDATYSDDMEDEEKDAEKNFALKENALKDNYEMTVEIKATAQSHAEDRVGVVMWYLDEDNFMIFYLDRWRQDSTVPRTTIYGRIGGETLPTTYNHGGWLAEGDNEVSPGLTQTQASQVTEWHTVKVVKEGNTFTCYVDTESNGYISYTVAAGLPDVTDKKVYSGIYAFNDAVLVRGYDVTAVGGFQETHTPCPSGHPYNASVEAPDLPAYAEEVTSDHYDGTQDNIKGNDNPNPSSSEPTNSQPSSSGENGGGKAKKKGCGGSLAGSLALGVGALLGAAFLLGKRKRERD